MTRNATQESASAPFADGRDFRTTHWSVVLLAGDRSSADASAALEKLCRTYWYPIYAFIRRKGHDAHEAQDLAQSFFARVLEKNYLEAADSGKGRFRTFLLTALTRFLANEWDRSRAAKRGGGQRFISLDDTAPEDRYQLEPVSALTPERIYEQRWAETVLTSVLRRLRQEFDGAGRASRFDELKGFLLEDKGAVSYAQAAARLGMSESAVKSGIFRLRQRYGELIREEIAQTVGTAEEVEAEIRHLLTILS